MRLIQNSMVRVSAAVLATASFSLSYAKIVVHMVPHTHDDVGYRKTVDQYYTGIGGGSSVKNILDTVVLALQQNPDRKFTYVEQAFFQRWWAQQSAETQAVVKGLVRSGQLSFSNGAWSMHDEATPYYMDMIDQTTFGHKHLMEQFGICPRTGWQIDPFGHSATQAALLSSEVGFSGLFFGRIDYQDLSKRLANKEPEFVWRASPSLGPEVQVFAGLTGQYSGNYHSPYTFNWDSDQAEPVQDDPRLNDYNVKKRVDEFVTLAMRQANQTRGRNIMWTMGGDFNYEFGVRYYANMDKIIKHVNEDGRMEAKYSTPEMYLDSKIEEAKQISWPLKEDDFFPYADAPHAYWTGYYTSRPAFKRYVRETSALLQMFKTSEIVFLRTHGSRARYMLEEAMGLAQHHDAVSGTEKQHVTFDYTLRLARARTSALQEIATAMEQTINMTNVQFCELRNVSVCHISQTMKDKLTVFSFFSITPMTLNRSQIIEIPVPPGQYQATYLLGQDLETELVVSMPSLTNYGRPAGGSEYTLLIQVPDPFNPIFNIKRDASSGERPALARNPPDSPLMIENDFLALEFCQNRLCKITNKEHNISVKAEQSWFWYEGSSNPQASGAYVFRPAGNNASPVSDQAPQVYFYKGSMVDEVHMVFSTWISQRIRLVKGEREIEITHTVGPIPVQDGIGKEIVTRITTDIDNKGECFTDSNGREMMKRKRNFRPTWKLNQTETVAGNYFPVSTALYIRDSKSQLTILTDASQAGTGCVQDGVIEMMVHRALLKQDGRGIGETLNETESVTPDGIHFGTGLVARGKHVLTLQPPKVAAQVWRPAMDKLYRPSFPFFSNGEPPITAGMKRHDEYLDMSQAPPSLSLISLEFWDADTLLSRIAHQYGQSEHPTLSQPVMFDAAKICGPGTIERGLTGTISRSEVLKRRVKWNVDGKSGEASNITSADENPLLFQPLQIRTYLTPRPKTLYV